jgi:hypothetical protein
MPVRDFLPDLAPEEWQAVAAVITALATIVLAGIAVGQMRATRHAAEDTKRSSVRPLVYAHALSGIGWSDTHGLYVFPYYLRNHGVGPALNVAHGVEIVCSNGSKRMTFGSDDEERGLQFRTLEVSEVIPPLDPAEPRAAVPPSGIDTVGLSLEEFNALGDLQERIYWCRFGSLYGDRWETRNSSDGRKPPTIKRI